MPDLMIYRANTIPGADIREFYRYSSMGRRHGAGRTGVDKPSVISYYAAGYTFRGLR